ncbi:MAG: hypothetical protein KDD70_17310 [Bdellovibrionales bacterium]|nr:hypothetical protein [Bdellovibrionales bacterium]
MKVYQKFSYVIATALSLIAVPVAAVAQVLDPFALYPVEIELRYSPDSGATFHLRPPRGYQDSFNIGDIELERCALNQEQDAILQFFHAQPAVQSHNGYLPSWCQLEPLSDQGINVVDIVNGPLTPYGLGVGLYESTLRDGPGGWVVAGAVFNLCGATCNVGIPVDFEFSPIKPHIDPGGAAFMFSTVF